MTFAPAWLEVGIMETTVQSTYSSRRTRGLTAATYAVAGLIAVALAAQYVVYISSKEHTSSVPVDIFIFGALGMLFSIVGIRFLTEKRYGRAVVAFVGAGCWVVYTIILLAGLGR